MDDLWQVNGKYIGFCAKCKREGLKRNMKSLYIKDGSYGPVRIMCHLCPQCLLQLLDELEVSMPE